MGVTGAIAVGAGSSLLGAGLQYGENKAARKRSQQATDQANAVTSAPLPYAQQTNSGQDSFLQYLRSNPGALKPFQFDASQAFQDLKANDNANIGDQAAALSAGAGSLGARFGSAFASKDALLRSRFAGDISARNAGIAQSSFNTALGAGMQDFSTQNVNRTQAAQLELQRRQQVLQGLGFGATLPQPGTAGIVGQTGGDISQLLTLMNYFNSKNAAPTPAASAPSGFSLPSYQVPSFTPQFNYR